MGGIWKQALPHLYYCPARVKLGVGFRRAKVVVFRPFARRPVFFLKGSAFVVLRLFYQGSTGRGVLNWRFQVSSSALSYLLGVRSDSVLFAVGGVYMFPFKLKYRTRRLDVVMLSILMLVNRVGNCFANFAVFVRPPILLPTYIQVQVRVVLYCVCVLFSRVPTVNCARTVTHGFMSLFVGDKDGMDFTLVKVRRVPADPIRPRVVKPRLVSRLHQVNVRPRSADPIVLILH